MPYNRASVRFQPETKHVLQTPPSRHPQPVPRVPPLVLDSGGGYLHRSTGRLAAVSLLCTVHHREVQRGHDRSGHPVRALLVVVVCRQFSGGRADRPGGPPSHLDLRAAGELVQHAADGFHRIVGSVLRAGVNRRHLHRRGRAGASSDGGRSGARTKARRRLRHPACGLQSGGGDRPGDWRLDGRPIVSDCSL